MSRRLAIALTAASVFASACGEEEKPKAKPEMSARAKATQPTPASEKKPAPAPAPELPSEEPGEVVLEKLGYTIEVPGTWTMKELNPQVVTFRIPGGDHQAGALIPYRLDVRQQPKAPKNVDTAAKSCPADVIDKQKEDSGNFYYVCKQTAVGRTLLNFQYVVPNKGKEPALICSGSGAKVDALLAACKTLVKQ